MKNERIRRLDVFRRHDVLKLLEGDSNIGVELDKRALRLTGWFGTAPRSARFVEQLFSDRLKRKAIAMAGWRMKWVWSQIASNDSGPMNGVGRVDGWRYWGAVALKFIPHLWPFEVKLRLRGGGVVNIRQFMTLYIYREIFVDGCYDVALPTDSPNVIDIGANVGLFALRTKKRYPMAQIVCFEPLPENFNQLIRTIEANNMTGCVALQKGVGGSSRSEKLFVHARNSGGHSIIQSEAGSDRHVTIELMSMAEALAKLDGGRCDLLKLDCEGAEYEILKSLNAELASKIDVIVYEPTPKLYKPAELNDWLQSLGYQVAFAKGLFFARRTA